ncbi:MAG: lysine--tRNA ligase [Pseudomonadota bacterium]
MSDNPLYKAKQAKLNSLAQQGIDPYPARFSITNHAQNLQDRFRDLADDTPAHHTAAIAGRVMAVRNKNMFIDLHDGSGKMQVFCPQQSIKGKSAIVHEHIDIGDIIGVRGPLRRTRRGELTLDAQDLVMLSKSLQPLPEKYHGLSDTEMRFRQRYIDWIMDPARRALFYTRARVIQAMRDHLCEKGFLEVETPMLQPIAGGATARPFITYHNALDTDLYLRVAPELYLKKMIVGGFDRVFEINRCFRNEGLSTKHNPEFTSLEVYQSYTDYRGMIDLAEALLVAAAHAALGKNLIAQIGDHAIDFTPPYACGSMLEFIKKTCDVDFAELDEAQARAQAEKMKVPLTGREPWGKIVEAVFGEHVEPTLINPTHVTDFPKDVSPLARTHLDDPRLTERFETYINGWEVANAFSELTDPGEQRRRFAQQASERDKGDTEAQVLDEDFIIALEHGLPPTGGLGIGIDRLMMILTGQTAIREVIAFPTLRPK